MLIFYSTIMGNNASTLKDKKAELIARMHEYASKDRSDEFQFTANLQVRCTDYKQLKTLVSYGDFVESALASNGDRVLCHLLQFASFNTTYGKPHFSTTSLFHNLIDSGKRKTANQLAQFLFQTKRDHLIPSDILVQLDVQLLVMTPKDIIAKQEIIVKTEIFQAIKTINAALETLKFSGQLSNANLQEPHLAAIRKHYVNLGYENVVVKCDPADTHYIEWSLELPEKVPDEPVAGPSSSPPAYF